MRFRTLHTDRIKEHQHSPSATRMLTKVSIQ